MIIRSEEENDIPFISNLLKQAFFNQPHSNNDEYLLVDKLRKRKALTLSYVAIINNEIVGYIAFSPITIDGKKSNLLGLAPIAILPKYQRKGIGSTLINSSLTQIKKQRFDGCVLVGFPDFYQKLGFISADPLVYLDADKQYFMKLLFKKDIALSGEVEFHPAFYS